MERVVGAGVCTPYTTVVCTLLITIRWLCPWLAAPRRDWDCYFILGSISKKYGYSRGPFQHVPFGGLRPARAWEMAWLMGKGFRTLLKFIRMIYRPKITWFSSFWGRLSFPLLQLNHVSFAVFEECLQGIQFKFFLLSNSQGWKCAFIVV